jgi:hypothetical protein
MKPLEHELPISTQSTPRPTIEMTGKEKITSTLFLNATYAAVVNKDSSTILTILNNMIMRTMVAK